MAPRLHFVRALPIAILGLAALHVPSHAGWPNNPAVNVPLCTAAGQQTLYGSCVADGAGGAIAVWTDPRSGVSHIYAQRVSDAGRALWTAGGVVVSGTTYSQYDPCVVADGAGGALVAWNDQRSGTGDIYVQRVSASGVPLWTANGVALCTATNVQDSPEITSDGAGGAIVVWRDYRNGTDYNLYAQRVNASGSVQWSAGGVAFCTAALAQQYPTPVSDGSGGAVIVWTDYRNGNDWNIYAQRLGDDGSESWTTNGMVVCAASSLQDHPGAISDGAGGVIACWEDSRGSDWDIYVQRVNGSGTALWTADGLAVCAATGNQSGPGIVPDGGALGGDGVGAIVAWSDERGGSSAYDIYAQRVSGNGAVQWTAGGVVLCDAVGMQTSARSLPDGVGGGIVAWQDYRSGTSHLYAQRVNGSGVSQWTGNGVPFGTAGSSPSAPALVTDLAGGVIAVWWDFRADLGNVYAQRVDQWGYLGPQPVIAGVEDIPNDEGGQVKLSWYASPLDSFPSYSIYAYYIWRSVPPNLVTRRLAAGATLASADDPARPTRVGSLLARSMSTSVTFWENLDVVYARHLPGYSYLAPTICDSVAGSNPPTLFMVEARVSGSSKWWFSDPDSGYSVDDLAPATPSPFAGQYAGGTSILSWGESAAADFAAYRLYRGHGADFEPGEENLLATLTSTDYVDVAGAPYYYKVCAVDVHGNASPCAGLLPTGAADVIDIESPVRLALSAPAPNPLRGSTTLQLVLPRATRVSVAVFDQQGRRVRTLASGTQPAGEHAITWDGRDDGRRVVPSGIYFVRCAVEGRTLTRRIVALR